jgi:4'-phosphopantetheinyl transferase
MSRDECARELRFRFARDRRTYVIARALVRVTLSRYAPLPPREWRFVAGRYGRPSLIREQFAMSQLSFNLSHTSDVIAVAVRKCLRIGLDVESVRRDVAALELAARFFSPAEANALHKLSGAVRDETFFDYWTLKEAYVKARGEGLTIPLDRFSFSLFPASVRMSDEGDLGDVPERWCFWQCGVDREHVMAVCAERGPVGETLSIHRCVPLVRDEPFEPRTLRCSDPATVAS